MRKIQIFIIVEAILLTMALITILAGDFSRVTLLSVLFFLSLYYYFGKQRTSFFLVTAALLLFFVMMLNPYVIAAVLFAVIYGLFVATPYIYRDNEDTHLIYEEETVIKEEKNRWLGDLHHFSSRDHCSFDDINLFRVFGNDTVHLDEVILSNYDNVIILRKFFGNTKIILPPDVAVHLQVNNLYGQLLFLNQPVRELRNETLTIATPDYQKATKGVKIVISNMAGNIEVVRK